MIPAVAAKPSIDDFPLNLDSPSTVSLGHLGINSARTITALNDGLSRAFQTDNPIAKIAAIVRCELLGMTVRDLAANSDLNYGTALSFEEANSNKETDVDPAEKFQKLFAFWKKIADERKKSQPDLVTKITAAKEKILDLLTEKFGNSGTALLVRWRYEFGLAKFEEKTCIKRNALWQRVKEGATYSFGEVLEASIHLGLVDRKKKIGKLLKEPIFKRISQAWLNDANANGCHVSLARLHILIEVDKRTSNPKDLPYTQAFLTQLGVTDRAALRVAGFEFCEWEKIKPYFDKLVERKIISQADLAAIKTTWEQELATQPPACHLELKSLFQKFDLGYPEIARVLGITQTRKVRPETPVYRAINYGEYSPEASFGVLAALVAESIKDLDLRLEARRAEVSKHLKRISSRIKSPVGIEMDLWGLSFTDITLEDGTLIPKEGIQKIIWGQKADLRIKDREISEAQLLERITEIGKQKARLGVENLIAARRSTNIVGLVKNACTLHGQAPIAKAAGTSFPTLNTYLDARDVPSLPQLKRLCTAAKVPLTTELQIDWINEYSRKLASEGSGDLERSIRGFIGQKADSKSSFLRATEGRDVTPLQYEFDRMSGVGVPEQEVFEKITARLSLQSKKGAKPLSRTDQAAIEFVDLVFKHGNIVEAIRTITKSNTRIKEALEAGLAELKKVPEESDLEKLLEDKLHVLSGTIKEHKILDKFAATLRLLPGATIDEVKAALENKNSSATEEYRRFSTLCRANGIGIFDIAYACKDNVDLRSNGIGAKEAISRGVSSPAFPLGVLAYFAGKDKAEIEQFLTQARTSIREDLKRLGFLEPHSLLVEMRLWGIRPRDLQLSNDAELALNSRNLNEEQQRLLASALTKTNELVEQKINSSLTNLIERKKAQTPSQIFALAEDSFPGGRKYVAEALRIPFNATNKIVAGELAPAWSRLEALCRAAEISLSHEVQLFWFDAYARYLNGFTGTRSLDLNSRMLYAHIGAKVEIPSEQAAEQAHAEHILATLYYQYARQNACEERLGEKSIVARTARITDEARIPLKTQLFGEGVNENTPAKIFLRYISDEREKEETTPDGQVVAAAIKSWFEKYQDDKNRKITQGFQDLAKWIATKAREDSNGEISQNADIDTLISAKSKLLRSQQVKAISEEMLYVMCCLAGASFADILKAAQLLSRADQPAVATEKVGDPLPHASLEINIFKLLHDAAKTDDTQEVGKLLNSLPPAIIEQLVQKIEVQKQGGLPWLIAAMAFYPQPLEAFAALAGLDEKLLNKKAGKDFFKAAQTRSQALARQQKSLDIKEMSRLFV